MNEPKILPWMARKAGISLDEARAVWQHAVAEAAALTGEQGSAAFHGLAVDRLITLLGANADDPRQSAIQTESTQRRARPQPTRRASLPFGTQRARKGAEPWREAA